MKYSEFRKIFENWWHPAEKTEIFLKFLYHYVPSFSSISWVSSFGLVVKTVNFKSKVRGFNPPQGKNFFWKFFFVCFLYKISIFYILTHRKRYKWTLFYFLKVYNNCSFSFSSKMTFSISQLDVTNFKNWDMPKKRFSEYISEMPTNILVHFFSRVFLQKFNSLVWRLGFKLRFRSRMSSKFKNNRGFWSTSKPPYNDEEKSHGALF